MGLTKNNLRHCMFFQFLAKKNSAHTAQAFFDVYGQDTISERICQRWFVRFSGGKYDLNYDERSGRPKKFQTHELEELLDKNPAQTTLQLAEQLGVNGSTVL